uniref:Copia protein n=1 Tax=Tanacetum cinerariifolium TaxID=118510 RepID=A0A6L2N991_TANCI|nr:copia protein [Tanacetum cinerariifolium]
MEPKKVIQALNDPSWIEAMREELLQFKLQKVWTLVDLPYGKRAIGSKWVFKNKLDERGIVIRNKAMLVAQGHTQEEGIYYEEVFAPVARIEAIRLFPAYASFKDFMMYQMDVMSAFFIEKLKKSDYAGASLDRKSTTRGCQFLECRLISWQCKKQTVVANSTTKADPLKVQDLSKLLTSKASIRRDLRFGDEGDTVVDEAVNEEMYDSLKRATTAATRLDAEQDRGNISKTQSKATPNKPSSLGTSSGGGPRRQDTMRDTIAQTRFENVSNFSNDPPLSRVNILRSGEDRLKLKELIELCTKLFDRVLNLETTKTAQAKEIANLKKRVKRLERKRKSRSHGLKILYKVELSARVESSADEESLGEEVDVEKEVAGKDVSVVEEVNAASIVTFIIGITPIISMDEITLAKALIEIKTSRPKAKGIVMQELSETPTPTPIVYSEQPSKVQDKGKGIMVEPEMPLKKKAQIILMKSLPLSYKLKKMNKKDYYELAERFQAEEQEQLTDVEKAKSFMKFMEKRRKFFAAKRAKEKRNKPPTKAQQRNLVCTYMKNIDGWKTRALKNKSFDEIQDLFNKSIKRVNMCVDMDTKVVESTKKDKAETVWSLETTCEFFIKSVRQLIDDSNLPKEEVAIRWFKVMPIKINVFAWRARLDKLLTRLNLSIKGIDISTIVCPHCHASVESDYHIFFSCLMACHLWRKLMHWWELEDIDLASYDNWILWLNSSRLSKRLKGILEGDCYVKWWLI